MGRHAQALSWHGLDRLVYSGQYGMEVGQLFHTYLPLQNIVAFGFNSHMFSIYKSELEQFLSIGANFNPSMNK